MNMKSIKFALTLATALVMTAGISYAGSWFGKSSTKDFQVTLDSAAKLRNGTLLKAGDYSMKIPENTQSPKVEFYTQGRLVATIHAKVQNESQKNEYTAIETTKKGDTNVITAIDPIGWRERLVFGGSGSLHSS